MMAVADLESGRLRLARNQYVRGYSVLISARHVREPYELADDESARFFADVVRAGRALDRVFSPTKLNFELLGNSVPHLHCHLVPRYYGDPGGDRPIDPHREEVVLPADEYRGLVAALRETLAAA